MPQTMRQSDPLTRLNAVQGRMVKMNIPDAETLIDLKFKLSRHSLALFFSKVEVAANGCWNWTAALSRRTHGYGAFQGRGAHRVSFAWFVGPIPDGCDLDHLCKNQRCVNPAHMEAVTPEENRRRVDWLAKGTCKRGHALVGDNVRMHCKTHQVRICHECERLRRSRRKSRAK